MADAPELAFLSQGKLHLVSQEEVTVLASAYAEETRRREEEIHRRNAWKSEGTGARFMSGGLLMAAEGLAPSPPALISSLARGRESGQLLYTIQVGSLSGLFAYDVGSQHEQRLHHGREESLMHLSAPGPDGAMACTVESKDGARHLALLSGEAFDIEDVTEGDSRDEAPSWARGRRAIVYQSAGIARSPEGYILGTSPYAIHRLDLDSGSIEELATRDGHDLLAPKQQADGTLLFIQRPHGPRRTSLFQWMIMVVLFPFRLLWAIIQWLNFFTIRYTGKPLTTADGKKLEGADARQMMIWGNLIDVAKADQEARRRGEDAPSLVGNDWKLIKMSPDGRKHVVAENVLSFDLDSDDRIVYTDGSTMYAVDDDGRAKTIGSGRFIEQVIAL